VLQQIIDELQLIGSYSVFMPLHAPCYQDY